MECAFYMTANTETLISVMWDFYRIGITSEHFRQLTLFPIVRKS